MRKLEIHPLQTEVLVCDRCGKEMDIRHLEWKQAFSFSFRGGYGSVFDDGDLVEGDFCEDCIKNLLGPKFRVTGEDPWKGFEIPDDYPPFYDIYIRQLADAESLFGMLREALTRKRRALLGANRPAGDDDEDEKTGHDA